MEKNFETVKTIIQNCRFAAMKCWGIENFLQKRCITETINIKDDGIIECIAYDAAHPSKRKCYTKNSKVDLKYVNKEQDIYLIIKGRVIGVQNTPKEISTENGARPPATLLDIKILEVEFYERRHYTPSMSFLFRKKKQYFTGRAA